MKSQAIREHCADSVCPCPNVNYEQLKTCKALCFSEKRGEIEDCCLKQCPTSDCGCDTPAYDFERDAEIARGMIAQLSGSGNGYSRGGITDNPWGFIGTAMLLLLILKIVYYFYTRF